MTTTLQVVQAFDTYKAGDQISGLADTVAQALQNAYPGRFQFVSSDGSSGGTTPGPGSGGTTTPSTGTGPSIADVDAEIATAFTAKGVPPGATVPGLISTALAAAGAGSGLTTAQAAALAIALG